MLRMSSRVVCLAARYLVTALFGGLALSASAQLTDTQGHIVTQLSPSGARIVVLVFAATDCPISNRYIPEIARLEQIFSTAGVAFRWVFPNPDDTAPVVRKHNEEFSIHSPSLIDAEQKLVRMAHVAVTPEAAVFRVEGTELRETYHGRIDDRYVAFGRERPQATRHELEEAIQAALAGKPAPLPGGEPVGCSIVPRKTGTR